MKRTPARLAAIGAIALACLLVWGGTASAHPLGNFTINTAAGVTVRAHEVMVVYVLDMAEIPTFQTVEQFDRDGDGKLSPSEAEAYAAPQCLQFAQGLDVRAGAKRLALGTMSHRIGFRPGVAGLSTLRLECTLGGEGDVLGSGTLRISDTNFAGRRGWHEITIAGDGVESSADVPERSPSRSLTAYPKDLLSSPLDVRSATAKITGGSAPSASGGAPIAASRPGSAVSRIGVDRATRWFASLIGHRTVTSGFAAIAVLAALALGALHAFAPGHGKTAFAATLIAERGTMRDVLLLAGTVTATHSAGVVALGLLLAASGTAATDRLYPWLGVASGLLVAAVGIGLLRRAIKARRDRAVPFHSEDHQHPHPHALRARSLVALGLAGGMAPSPSALLVLLASITLGRVWLGAGLVLAYGLGMAMTLIGIGLVLSRASRAVERRASAGKLLRWSAALRPISALAVIGAGILLTARGVAGI